MRQHPPAGRIIYFYVVDADNRLHGVVPTRRLLLSPLDKPLSEIMVRQMIVLPPQATVLDACEFFTLHRLLAFPVVDDKSRLLGVIDVDLYTDELSEIGGMRDDVFQLIGVHLARTRQTAPVAAFRSRFPWLLCNIAAGILAAFLSGLFESELQRVVALALFIPVVLALAESVSIQSVSLALQALHGQTPTWLAIVHKLRWELLTGLLLGCASGLLVGLVAVFWQGRLRVALCLLGGIGGGVAGAAVVGMAMPNLLRLLKRDPQVAAGPIVLALADMLTLLIYFNLARWLLG
jgi:magnesium transporter